MACAVPHMLLTRTSSRIRHLKCDEQKPACLRCTSSGRRCDGYVPAGVIQLSVDVPGDDEERRGYHFFRLKSVGVILGQQDADFWKSLFLQASHSQPAIKHALIAIASVHESIELSGTDIGYNHAVARRRRAFSLMHYNKAIQLLIRDTQASSDRLATALILCILFIVFEEYQSGYTACDLHLRNGLAIFHQWRTSTALSTGPGKKLKYWDGLIKNHIAPVLNRLVMIASTFTDSRIHARDYITHPARPATLLVPPQFVSYTQARGVLDELMMWTFCLAENLEPSSVPRIRAMLEKTLEDWLRAFTHLLETTETKLNPRDLQARRFMQMYYHVSFIIVDAYLSEEELVFDKYTQRFREIVDMIQEILLMDAGMDEQHKLSFSFDFGVTPPLYFTACHCRDPLIRRAALALMRTSHDKQGAWNSEHTAKCAEQIIKIEEAGLVSLKSCNDVPGELRIRKVHTDVLHENGCIKMVYVHAPYDLKAPLRTVYIPLHTDAARSCATGHLPSRSELDEAPGRSLKKGLQ